MTTLETMYAPQANSPTTSTVGAMTTISTNVTVLDASILPSPPMLLVLGGESESAETVLVTNIEGNLLTLTRAVEGMARAWEPGTTVARLFTAKDLKAVQDNIVALNQDKAERVDIPSAYTASPQMDGTASAGSSSAYSRGDHVHPSDTAKQDKINVSGLLKGNGSGGVSAAVAGTDYVAVGNVPSVSDSAPLMDGAASAGSSAAYSRGDHVHPTDTSRQAAISATGLLKGSGGGAVSAAVAGTDYVAPSALSGYIPTSQKGVNNGVASLNSNGKVEADQASATATGELSSFTLPLNYAGKLVACTNSSAITITVPTNSAVAFPIGTEIEILRYYAGAVTIAAASGVTIYCKETARTIKDQYTSVALKKFNYDEWILQGNVG